MALVRHLPSKVRDSSTAESRHTLPEGIAMRTQSLLANCWLVPTLLFRLDDAPFAVLRRDWWAVPDTIGAGRRLVSRMTLSIVRKRANRKSGSIRTRALRQPAWTSPGRVVASQPE